MLDFETGVALSSGTRTFCRSLLGSQSLPISVLLLPTALADSKSVASVQWQRLPSASLSSQGGRFGYHFGYISEAPIRTTVRTAALFPEAETSFLRCLGAFWRTVAAAQLPRDQLSDGGESPMLG